MFEWKDIYSVDIKEIDNQHKRLFELGGNLYDVLKSKDDIDNYDEMMRVLDELRDYTIYHFGCEEKMMKKCDYEYYERHKQQHDDFVAKIKEVYSKDIDEQQKRISMDLIAFIADWIAEHIMKTDKNYVQILKSKGVV